MSRPRRTSGGSWKRRPSIAGGKWSAVYEDAGISGAKGRDKRPGLDAMLKQATRGKFDVVMAWAVDRLGRSLLDLVSRTSGAARRKRRPVPASAGHRHHHPCRQGDVRDDGRVLASSSESMIQARVKAGMARIKAGAATKSGKPVGRPTISAVQEKAIRDHLAAGTGMLKTASLVGVGSGTVQKVAAAMKAGV